MQERDRQARPRQSTRPQLPLGRVTSVTYPDSTSESFTYDDAGNRTRRIASGGDDWTYHYDAADQLTHVTATSGGATLESFTHDDAGRRTGHIVTATGATTSYGYDGFGRLTSVSRTGYSATLQYGPDGRRTSRTETGAPSALYPSPRLEQRGGTGYRTLRAGGVGPALAEIETTGSGPLTHAFHRDASQNLAHVVTTDEAGTSTSEGPPRRWTAFGTLRSGTSVIERGFASQVQEGATGLLYMAARHYDPRTSRFLQVDPLGIDAAELYAYAANNPYAFWDPTGLIPAPIPVSTSLTLHSGIAGRQCPGGSGPCRTPIASPQALQDQSERYSDRLALAGAATALLIPEPATTVLGLSAIALPILVRSNPVPGSSVPNTEVGATALGAAAGAAAFAASRSPAVGAATTTAINYGSLAFSALVTFGPATPRQPSDRPQVRQQMIPGRPRFR